MDIKLLVATLPEDTKLAPWFRKLGISRRTAYKWRARDQAEGVAGLEDRSRAPERPAGRVDAGVEDAVVAARKELAEAGYRRRAGVDRRPAPGPGPGGALGGHHRRITVRRGQVDRQPAERPKVSYRRVERSRPNECW